MPLPSPWRRRRRSGQFSFRALFSPITASSSPSYTRLPPPPPDDGDDDDTMAAAGGPVEEEETIVVSSAHGRREAGTITTTPIVPTTPHPDDDGDGHNDDDDDEIDAVVLAKRVVRKIDRRLMPLLFVTYALNFMDKTIMSSAAVFGLGEDNHLVGQQYAWASAAFYFGYLAWAYPTNLLIPRVPGGVARYLALNAVAWGAVVAATAACASFAGLVACRVLLGAAEATVTPACMFLTTSWYTRDEVPVRTGLWFAGNSAGGLVASLFAFGVGHISPSSGWKPWRWMYLILGLVTFLWGFVLWAFLPSNNPATAPFLTPRERRLAQRRVVVAGTGRTAGAGAWRWAQAAECLRDPKTWCLVGLELLTQVPNGGTQSFANLVTTSTFGFTSLQSTLLNIPYSLLSAAAIALTGYLAGRFRQANCLLLVLVVLPPVAGAALIYARAHTSRPAQLVGYFLLATGPAAMPLALSLAQANYRGVTKKVTVTALLLLAYCAGNIAGPQFFKAAEAPTYDTAFRTIMTCYALSVLLAAGLRTYLGWENKRRAAEEGFEGSAGAAGAVGESGKIVDGREVLAVGGVELRSEDYDDVTDWQIRGFRYRL